MARRNRNGLTFSMLAGTIRVCDAGSRSIPVVDLHQQPPTSSTISTKSGKDLRFNSDRKLFLSFLEGKGNLTRWTQMPAEERTLPEMKREVHATASQFLPRIGQRHEGTYTSTTTPSISEKPGKELQFPHLTWDPRSC